MNAPQSNLNKSLKRQSNLLESESHFDETKHKVLELEKENSNKSLKSKSNFNLDLNNNNIKHSYSFLDTNNVKSKKFTKSKLEESIREDFNSLKSASISNSNSQLGSHKSSSESSTFYESTMSIFDQLEKSISSMSSQATQRYQPNEPFIQKDYEKNFLYKRTPTTNSILKNFKCSSNNSIPYSSVYSFITAPTTPMSILALSLNTNLLYNNQNNLNENEVEDCDEIESLSTKLVDNYDFEGSIKKSNGSSNNRNENNFKSLAYCTYNKATQLQPVKKYSSIFVNSTKTIIPSNEIETKSSEFKSEAESKKNSISILDNNFNSIQQNNICNLNMNNDNNKNVKIKPGSLLLVRNASETSV